MAGSAKRRRTTLVSKGGPGQAVAGELASKRHRARNGEAAAEVARDIRRCGFSRSSSPTRASVPVGGFGLRPVRAPWPAWP